MGHKKLISLKLLPHQKKSSPPEKTIIIKNLQRGSPPELLTASPVSTKAYYAVEQVSCFSLQNFNVKEERETV